MASLSCATYTSGTTATCMCSTAQCHCGAICQSVRYVASTIDYAALAEAREAEIWRKDRLRVMGEYLHELGRKLVHMRSQLPIGFHPLAPLARNNC